MVGIFLVIIVMVVAFISLNSIDEARRKVLLIKWKYPIRSVTAILLTLGGYFAYQEITHQAELAAHRAKILAKDKAEVAKSRTILVNALSEHGLKPYPGTLFLTGRIAVDLMKGQSADESRSFFEKLNPSEYGIFDDSVYITSVKVADAASADPYSIYCSYWVRGKKHTYQYINEVSYDHEKIKADGRIVSFTVQEESNDVMSFFKKQAEDSGFTPDADNETSLMNKDVLFRNDEFIKFSTYHSDSSPYDIVSVDLCFGKIAR